MGKLNGLTGAAKFHKIWSGRVSAHTPNATRWSSMFEIFLSCKKIKILLRELKSDEVVDMALTPRKDRKLNALFKNFKNLESVTKALQRDATTLRYARLISDVVM